MSDDLIDFSELETYHTLLLQESSTDAAAGNVSSSDDQAPLDFPVDEILHLTVLSRVVECLRFTLRSDLLDSVVSLDTLKRELKRLQVVEGETAQNEDDQTNLGKGLKDVALDGGIDDLVEKLWTSWEQCQERERRRRQPDEKTQEREPLTFGELLDYQFPSFPETTAEDRAQLHWLGNQRPVISEDDVCKAVGVKKDSQLVEYIFFSGAKVLSAEVFRDIVASLSLTPRALSFAPAFADKMVGQSRRGTSVFPNLVILILIMALTPWIANITQHTAHLAVFDFIGNDWSNGCQNGTTSELGCNLIRRNLELLRRAGTEGMRFAKEELLLRIWQRPGHRAIDDIFGSFHLVGALSVRHSPSWSVNSRAGAKAKCQASNISTSIFLLEDATTFGCDDFWHFHIPFNYTLEEALAVAEKMINITVPTPQSSALIYDFAGYQPTSNLLLHARVVVAFPHGGAAIPYLYISPIDPRVAGWVFPIFILQLVSTGVVLITAVSLQARGVWSFGPDFLFSFANAVLVSTAYGLLRSAEPYSDLEKIGGTLYQAEFVPPEIDVLARDFNSGMTVLGFYFLFFISGLGRFLRDVGGLQLVVSVLRRCAVELATLLVIFLVWTVAFTCAAMTLFGATVDDNSTFGSSFLKLLDYFQSRDNYDQLVAHHAIIGPAFFFIYQLFVVLFALNLLVAVLTAPLTDVKAEMSAENEKLIRIEEEVIVKAPGSTSWDVFKWRLYSRLMLPLGAFLYDARPIGRGYWLQTHLGLEKLYPMKGNTDVQDALEAGLQLLDSFGDVGEKVREWNSPLLRHVVQENLFQTKVATALTIAMCTAETPLTALRDARLLSATALFGSWYALLSGVQDSQAHLTPIATEQSQQMQQKLILAMQAAETAFNSMTRDQISSAGPVAKLELEKLVTVPLEDLPEHDTSSCNPLRAPSTNAIDIMTDSENIAVSALKGDRFHFGEHLDALLRSSVVIVIYAVVVLAFAIWLTLGYTSADEPTAYLTYSLDNGLRDMYHTQRCSDAACTSGQTWEKVFADNVHLTDWMDWMNHVVEPQIFMRRRLNMADPHFPDLDAVMWDARVVRKSPLVLRQLRGSRKPCHTPPDAADDITDFFRSQRRHDISSVPCFGWGGVGGALTKEDMPIPSTGVPATMSPASYQYDDKCHTFPETYYGGFGTYDCGGYVAFINDSASLRAVLTSGWIDNATRLVSVSGSFQMGNAIVNYTVIEELGDQGHSVAGRSQVLPITNSDVEHHTEAQRITFQALLGIEVIIFTIRFLFYLAVRNSAAYTAAQIARIKPVFPFGLAVIVTLFIICYIVWSGSEQRRAQMVLVIVYTHVELSRHVIFPFASLQSKSIKVLVDTLSLAALHCTYILPFLGIFYISFTYSAVVVFGRGVPEFAIPRLSFQAVLLGTFGIADNIFNRAAMEWYRPIEAQVFAMLFFCAVLVVLANMFLAMVTSASADAQQTPPSILVAENVQYFYKRRPLYGEWVVAYLAMNVFWIKLKVRYKKLRDLIPAFRRKRTKDPVILTPWGRLWFPCECLVPRIRPMRVTYLLQRFHYDKLNSTAYAALVPFILENYLDFCEKEQILHAEDDAGNATSATCFVKGVAHLYFLRRLCEADPTTAMANYHPPVEQPLDASMDITESQDDITRVDPVVAVEKNGDHEEEEEDVQVEVIGQDVAPRNDDTTPPGTLSRSEIESQM